MSLKQYLSEVSLPVYVAVILFAMSSWIDINGLFVEVPLFVDRLPEGWSLYAYLAIVVQIANIGPIGYMIAKRIFGDRIKEWHAVYVILVVGATVCLLRAFFWDVTTVIGGELHSTALFVLVGFLALVDCSSSVVYLPYMGQYKPQYITAYYIGEGLSGMIPGFVGLIQGVESDPECINRTVNGTTNDTEYEIVPEYPAPLFSVEVFFFFLFSMMLVSGISFSLLNFHPVCKKERIQKISSEPNTEKDSNIGLNTLSTSSDVSNSSVFNLESSQMALTRQSSADGENGHKPKLTKAQIAYMLLITGWTNALSNSVLPSTQSYTCLPYGSLAFTLAVRLSTVANPLMCFLALFVGTKSLVVVGIVSVLATGLSGLHLYLAAMSPYPPLKDTVAGTALVIIVEVVNTAFLSYTKVTSASVLNEAGGPRALLWFGFAIQIGSSLGAAVIFIFVNVIHVFMSEPACARSF